MEDRLQDGLQVELDDFLGEPIRDRRNPQRSGFRLAVAIRDVDPSNRWGQVAPRGHSVPELVELIREVSLEVCNRLSVYSSRPLVGWTPKISTRSGVINEPPPTPVNPTRRPMVKPERAKKGLISMKRRAAYWTWPAVAGGATNVQVRHDRYRSRRGRHRPAGHRGRNRRAATPRARAASLRDRSSRHCQLSSWPTVSLATSI